MTASPGRRGLPAAAPLAGASDGRGSVAAGGLRGLPGRARRARRDHRGGAGLGQSPRARGRHDVRPRRMTAVRGFARYLAGIDPATEVPPLGLVPYRPRWRPDLHLL